MSSTPEQVAEALRASLKEAERLRQRNRRLRDAASEPIAIVGMSCRFPGGADSPDALWKLLAAGGDAISDFPTDRGWEFCAYDAELERFGVVLTRGGGFLLDAGGFDREFFGISPREALGMDPQQRLLLEASWEALEDAGIDPHSLHGSPTGVFAGAMYHDYGWGLSPVEESAAYLSTGGSSSLVSGRVAYTLGLEGPAMSVDTACSSSLVALHLAVHALRNRECSLALAGGATVYSTPGVFIQFSAQRILSPDGRCKAYAEGADGAGFSEGAGMLLLERLSEAERNDHPVLATIRGSAVNQDGASNGITAPNGPSQERVIRQALEDARLSAEQVDAVEGHGTGTSLGDPIEARALLATYGAARRPDRPLRLGSIKSNIGHPQAAAGVAGVIKMVLALREEELPRSIHLDQPSSHVDWDSGAVELLTEPVPWRPGEDPRRAGVSSFGATGTNAHLILEEAPTSRTPAVTVSDQEPSVPEAWSRRPALLPLSAKTEPALRQLASRLSTHLRENPELDPVDAAYSLATGRSHFARRAAIAGEGSEQLLEGLDGLARGEPGDLAIEAEAAPGGQTAFLFPGGGSHWQGMGLELIDASPSFAAHIRDCEAALAPHVDWSLGEVLRDREGAWTERIEVVQPALFAVMVSLARLWQEMGVEPSVVVGHSLGECAAAHIAGGLSLEDATMLVAKRSRLISRLVGKGGLASVALAPQALQSRLAEEGGQVEIAAVNGPALAIVSAEREPLDAFLERCEAEGIWARRVPTTMASHSRHVEELREEVIEALASLSPRSGGIPFHSTVTGGLLDTAELGPEYWYDNLRQTVLFEPVVRNLIAAGCRTLVEVSPHPVLSVGLQETAEDVAEGSGPAAVLGSLRRDEGGLDRLTRSLGEAYATGARVSWPTFFAGSGAKRVRLPTYPFQRERFWLTAADATADVGSAGLDASEHPLLGAAIERPQGDELILTGRLGLSTHPWLADHALAGTVLLPGTAFVEIALAAGRERGCETLEELTLEAPLVLDEEGSTALHVSLSGPGEDGRREVAIHSRPLGEEDGGAWTCHAHGELSPDAAEPSPRLEQWPPQGAEPLDAELAYERLDEAGFEYGPAFRGLVSAWRLGDETLAEVTIPPEQDEEARRFGLHPALFDAAGHAAIDRALTAAAEEAGAAGASVPFSWRGVRLYSTGATALRLRIGSGERGDGLVGFDRSGAPVLSVDSIVMRPVDPATLKAATRRRLPLHRLRWGSAEQARLSEPSVAILSEREIEGLAGERHPDLDGLTTAIAAGAEPPGLVVVDARASGQEPPMLPGAARERATQILALAQSFLAEEALRDARLAVLTREAVAVQGGESPDLATAPLWGLLRSAHSENPGRFALLDVDDSGPSSKVLGAALAAGADEPQLALREGQLLAPRLVRAEPPQGPEEPWLETGKTILVTGGTGGLGPLVARHLVERHGARHLLLVSRSGEAAPGAGELAAELEALGAEVSIAACDVAERSELEALLASIDPDHPLGAVFHCAGVLADGTLASLDAEQLERVMRPKADAAWHLHELTAGADLSAFVLFSSVMGVLGGAGQANYAAANAFLDALAAHRAATGLTAVSLAWGGWAQASAMIEDDATLGRLVQQVRARVGLTPMPVEQGLELLDASISLPDSQLVPAAFDAAVLRAQADASILPPPLRGLVRTPVGWERGSLTERLAEAPEGERQGMVLDLVRDQVAVVLGHPSAAAVEQGKAFRDLGFDSLAAVELRNRLVASTGLRLAPTVAFDYPSPEELADHLLELATSGTPRRSGTPARQHSSEDPIAIVGMACRYPGGADSPEKLWQLVSEGIDAISDFPEDRGWDLERLFDFDPERTDTSYADRGGFVYDSAEFDAEFFGISPREALVMDPQGRALLETSWEALEDCGVDPAGLRGSETGVFAGVMYQDYGSSDQGIAPGMTSSGVSGRVAYTFGFAGPAISVDTACSSSLVAMHLAAQALRGGECSLALAGGATVLSTPSIFGLFSFQRGLAADGRCKAFSESADGTGISEGTGVVVLERLSEAERNGHRVLATIRGSAVNQDGASNGFSAPNGPAQERAIRQALSNAGLAPADVDMVEAHGTGTSLGDPIEAGALLATYGQDRQTPLKLGSVKSNIGHPQAAAGVAGVIKTVMAMREGEMPKTLHVAHPSSKIDWEAGRVELLTEPEAWQADGRPRRAAVSSFGATGTNAHMVLEQGPVAGPGPAPKSPDGPSPGLPGPLLLPLSARSEGSLRSLAGRLRQRIVESPELDPVDVGFSLATTRAPLQHRAVAIGGDRAEVLAGLAAIEEGGLETNAVGGRVRTEGRLAYLFSGQGSQRPGMGSELYEAYPVFAEAFDAACEQLDAQLGLALKDVVFDRGADAVDRLTDTTYAQPALFAIEVALFRLLESLGLVPQVLAGHSIGELSAAHVAGVFDLADAATLVAARGRLMGALPEGGAMLAVQASELELAAAIEAGEGELAIAALNGPRSGVLSGAEAAIVAAQAHWEKAGRKTKRLPVSHAFHSPLVDPMLAEFDAVARDLEYRQPQIPIVSTVTGEPLAPDRATDSAYWVAQVREPVRFADVVETLRRQGTTVCIELGPDAALSAAARECLEEHRTMDGDAAVLSPTMRAKQAESTTLAAALATAHAHGMRLDWEAFFAPAAPSRVPLPTYPFQRRRYWLDGQGAADPSAAGQVPADHPLLGAAIAVAGAEEVLLTGRLSLRSQPWLAAHAIGGVVLVPGTALVEMALRAGLEVGVETLEELVLQTPLVLDRQSSVQVQVAVGEPDDAGARRVAIHSRPADPDLEQAGAWSLHAEGILTAAKPPAVEPLLEWPPTGAEQIEVEDLYERLTEHGIEYGPAFRGVRAAWRAGETLQVELSLPDELAGEGARFGLHPALFDSIGHVGLDLALSPGDDDESPALALPFAWRGVQIASRGASSLRVRIDLGAAGGGFVAFDEAGDLVAAVDSLQLRPLEGGLSRLMATRSPLHRLDWIEMGSEPANGSAPPRIAALGNVAAEAAIGERYPSLEALGAAIDAGASAPDLLLAGIAMHSEKDASMTQRSRACAAEALDLVQAWLGEERIGTGRLCIQTTSAVAVGTEESADPAQATVWGLLRSAQSEHPSRFAVLDSDGVAASSQALPAALAATASEPQVALREGRALVPRLARYEPSPEERMGSRFEPGATVLITGGTGGLGSQLARHLVAERGADRLLLVSRSGGEAAGAAELLEELRGMGASAQAVACDVSDRDQLRELLQGVDGGIEAVVHAAGLTDDGLLASLDQERLDRVFAPKADAAWHLHELTADMDLSAFAMFSSVAGTIGTPGQANYAAANAFLDALAAHRHAQGLPAVSLAWGAWTETTGMTAKLAQADLGRLGRLGLAPISRELGFELFDLACATVEPQLVPAKFNRAGLRTQAAAGALPAVLRGLAGVGGGAVEKGSLAKRLAAVPEAQWERLTLDIVRKHVAALLGHPSGESVDPEAAFMDLGFDSLAAVELRNRLEMATGLNLPPTLVFDHPSTIAVTKHLIATVAPTVQGRPAVGDEAATELLAKLAATLPSLRDDERLRDQVGTELRVLLAELSATNPEASDGDELEAMSHEEMFELIDQEFGR
jgi:acyl transferase domain-containing protein/NAD(P)-dependent dehydrogenase (short-subunit alcohol dehydrogenase family)/acyl carrier protein